MKILILEDEPLVAQHLQKMLLNAWPDARVLAVLSSVKRAIHWMEQNEPPEVILSDIRLSDGLSFDVFERFPPACPVIFTTAYDEYALRAFEVHSVDYLLKPVSQDDLSRALERLKKRTSSLPLPADLQQLIQSFAHGQKMYKERFLAHVKNAWMPVMASEVACFHKDELIFLYNTSGDRLVTDFNAMDELEELLDPQLFFRANRQFIVHLQAVGTVNNTAKGLTLRLKKPNLHQVDISREKAQAFKRWVLGEQL